MKNTSLVSLVALLSALSMPGLALEWNARQMTLAAEPGAKEVKGRFEFHNPGKAAVRIVDLATSCDCTVARTASPDIAAGARGSIDFVFTIGKRTGLQEKRIFVQTDESPDPVVLELKVQLPAAAAPAAR